MSTLGHLLLWLESFGAGVERSPRWICTGKLLVNKMIPSGVAVLGYAISTRGGLDGDNGRFISRTSIKSQNNAAGACGYGDGSQSWY